MLIICNSCGYKWNYKGSLIRGTCPNCGYKVPIKNAETEEAEDGNR